MRFDNDLWQASVLGLGAAAPFQHNCLCWWSLDCYPSYLNVCVVHIQSVGPESSELQ